jgi:hypothetical protein
MTERRTKADGFIGSLEYIEKTYDEETRKKLYGSLPSNVRDFIGVARKETWAPPLFSSELWKAIAAHHPDPAEACKNLVLCGRQAGSYATNTYLRLLLKMLTAKMFAKKIPDIWSRDSNFGKITTGDLDEMKSGRLLLHFTELGSYPFFGPVCEGWFAFSLETMGLKNVKVAVQNWSLNDPDPAKLDFLVTWEA